MLKVQPSEIDTAKVGDRVKFFEEKKSYRIVARTTRFLICTKPYNLKKDSYLYTIVDLKFNVRGKDNYIWSKYDYTDTQQLGEAIADLESGKLEISRRNQIENRIEKFIKSNKAVS